MDCCVILNTLYFRKYTKNWVLTEDLDIGVGTSVEWNWYFINLFIYKCYYFVYVCIMDQPWKIYLLRG